MDSAEITRTQADGSFEYTYQGPGDTPPASLSGTTSGPHIWRVERTAVPAAYRGQGIALELVKAVVRDAQAAGAKIIPRCSYVAAQFVKHPEWAEVLAS